MKYMKMLQVRSVPRNDQRHEAALASEYGRSRASLLLVNLLHRPANDPLLQAAAALPAESCNVQNLARNVHLPQKPICCV